MFAAAAARGLVSGPANPWRRRAVLAGGVGLVAAWVIGAPRLLVGGGSSLAFRDVPGLAPFRMLQASGAVSGAGAVLVGLDGRKAASAFGQDLRAGVAANPCAALFGTEADPRLPIAFFSDFNCPNCRALDLVLAAYDARHPGRIRIIRHELPLLGAASTIASKAVLAAELQGGYAVLHERLIRAQMVTDMAYVAALAESVGLDGQRLVSDMQTPEIASALDRSGAIAALFGFYGTPATVIGRTAFLGAIPAADVEQIIDLERTAPKLVCGDRP
jgi:protein-disulfide isomerase